jgi:hypothetical protein
MKPSQRQTGDGSRSVDPTRFDLEWNGRPARLFDTQYKRDARSTLRTNAREASRKIRLFAK